ncbi:uncharacterized protein LOC143029109 isoform X2 [Oratosquilla oratoria]|uniref:uncharacterized protein LOC143029109 isoform X2 n=1 Tax=Oratosquilla oratoria TaxID=337810 RepID=UPI003F7577BD
MATTTRIHATACTTQHEPETADNSTAPKQKLALDQLSVVRFVAQVSLVQTVTTWSRTKWEEGRKLWYLWWLLASVEIVLLNFWILLHTLPWPDWALEYLHRIDEAVAKALEWTQGKIDWYWHPASKLRLLTVMAWRWSLWTIGLVLPLNVLRSFWKTTQASVEQNPIIKVALPDVHRLSAEDERKSNETKSEGEVEEWEEEFWGDEECLSDASDVANLSKITSFSHKDNKGRSVACVRKTATAEGRLRTVMERRVNAQLKLMRKNSIRFSRGVEHELDELAQAIKDEVLSRPYLFRPVAFLWAIAFNSVMLFFRILRGKKNRRSRISRKESIRRRSPSKPITPETTILPTTPGLKMSSEPTNDVSGASSSPYPSSISSGSPPGEREENFEGVQRKDVLGKTLEMLDSGVEGDDTHSEVESDRMFSTILEEDEHHAEEAGASAEDKNFSNEENESQWMKYEDGAHSPLSSSPTSASSMVSIRKNKKKILRNSRHGTNARGDSNSLPSKSRKRVTIQ